MPNAKWEEGSEIVVDTATEAPATGWTFGYVSVYRTGGLVAVHIEATFANNAAGLVTTLGADFVPGATVTTADGKFTIAASGAVTYTGSTSGGGTARCEAVYTAGAVSP